MSIENILKKVKELAYDGDEEDLGAEAIANHAYKNRFEAFRYGYNQAISDVGKLLESARTSGE